MSPLSITENVLCVHSVCISNELAIKKLVIWFPPPVISRTLMVLQLGDYQLTLDTNDPAYRFIWKGYHKTLILRGGKVNYGSSIQFISRPPNWVLVTSLTNSKSLTLKE